MCVVGGLDFFFEFVFVIGFLFGLNDDYFEIVIVVDVGNDIVCV